MCYTYLVLQNKNRCKMNKIQFQNDINKLIDVLPVKIKRNIHEGLLDEAIEIVLDIGRIPEIRLGNGKIISY